MSDLQCPATILLIAQESLESGGSALEGSGHLSGVFVASAVAADPGALAAATRLADDGGYRLSTLADVPDGTRLAHAIEDLADLHRGEAIAIVATRLVWNRGKPFIIGGEELGQSSALSIDWVTEPRMWKKTSGKKGQLAWLELGPGDKRYRVGSTESNVRYTVEKPTRDLDLRGYVRVRATS